MDLAANLTFLRIVNSAIILSGNDENFNFLYHDRFQDNFFTSKMGNESAPERVFQTDRLKDFHGSKYQIGFLAQKDITKSETSEKFLAEIFYFFDILKGKQNSSYDQLFYEFDVNKLLKAFYSNKLDIILNMDAPTPNVQKLYTYSTVSYCAFIPIPEKSSPMPLIDAFEWRIWVAFVISVLVMGIVWQLYKVCRFLR